MANRSLLRVRRRGLVWNAGATGASSRDATGTSCDSAAASLFDYQSMAIGMTVDQATSASAPQRNRVATKLDYATFFAFVVIWILPIAWHGAWEGNRVPVAGKLLNYLYGVSRLFASAPTHYHAHYIQIRLEGAKGWIDAPVTDYSQMLPVGYRTRMDWVLRYSRRAKKGMLQRQHAAEYIKRRYEQRNPGGPEAVSVRFLIGRFPVGEELAQQKGHWVTPSVHSLPKDQVIIQSTHWFDGRRLDRPRSRRR